MHPYPHIYTAAASGAATNVVTVSCQGLPSLTTAPPREFDGPGDQWSPETLLCAAVADCFILTFRGIARASKVQWDSLQCSVSGTLERVEGVSYFTKFATRAELAVPAGTAVDVCQRLLEKAEHSCLISNSLRGQRTLEANVSTR
jgi:organic hydroperoxide reductase OsmC/OhrA